MKFEIKPNIIAYIMGGFLTFMGVGCLGVSVAIFIRFGVMIYICALAFLVFGIIFVKTGMGMIVNRLQVYEDEIVIKEFMAKDTHIPVKDITSITNTINYDGAASGPYARAAMKINRRLTIYYGETDCVFKYSMETHSGWDKVMEFLEDLVKE